MFKIDFKPCFDQNKNDLIKILACSLNKALPN